MKRFSHFALFPLLSMMLMCRGDTVAQSPASETAPSKQTRDDVVWQKLRPTMLAFQDGGPREEFLAVCKALLADNPGSGYDVQLRSLIEPLEREAVLSPALVPNPAVRHTPEEAIRFQVFQLREVAGRQWSDPGYPELFPSAYSRKAQPMATDELVAIGPPAIPFLIQALEDDTPTRTIAWQRSYYPEYFVLRREDLAMKCLERITGCNFYDEGATFMHFHLDTPARRASVLSDVRAWWKLSQGTGQAQTIRNQLRLRSANITLRNWDEIDSLHKLAMIEGPENVIGRLRALLAVDHTGLNSPIVEAMASVDPQTPVRAAFARFRQNKSRDGDYTLLLRYGNRDTYREIARRYEATGKLDSGHWNLGDEMEWAARYGQNWAIPLLAKTLAQTKMTGSRGDGHIESQSFSDADVAVELFQKLTGHDFGYKREESTGKRLAAIKKASAWWRGEGKIALRPTIDADHQPLEEPGDLMWSESQISECAAHLTGNDDALRRKTVARLGKVSSYRVQRALLQVLDREHKPTERFRVLKVLQGHPALWHLPRLARVLEGDGDTSCRVLAGEIIKTVVGDKSSMLWWSRLESRDAALDVARRLVKIPSASPPVRHVAVEILRAWDSLQDRQLLAQTQAT